MKAHPRKRPNFRYMDEGVCEFNPERLITAICYHTVNDGHADHCEQQSVEAALDDLIDRNKHARIALSVWRGLSDFKKFCWLLRQTGYVVDLVTDPDDKTKTLGVLKPWVGT